jgi:hypothetical protein
MYPEVLREHIQKCKKETSKPLKCSNVVPNIEEIMKIIVEEGENRFTSAGIQNVDSLFKRKWYYRSTWSAVPYLH